MRSTLTFATLLALAALAHAGDAPAEGVHAPASSYLDTEVREGAPRLAWAPRLHRLEIEVRGPADAPLFVVATMRSGADGPFDPNVSCVLAHPVRDGARIGLDGAWRGRWSIPGSFAVGRQLLLDAWVVEAAGPRRLGAGLVLEVVDLWTFERERLADPRDRAGWSAPEAAGPLGSWRTRSFRGAGAGGFAELTVDVEYSLWADGPAPRVYVAASGTAWPDDGDPLARAAWFARAWQAGSVRAIPVPNAQKEQAGAQVGPVSGSARARLVAGHDDERGTHLVIGTGAAAKDWRLERVRVVLRAAR